MKLKTGYSDLTTAEGVDLGEVVEVFRAALEERPGTRG